MSKNNNYNVNSVVIRFVYKQYRIHKYRSYTNTDHTSHHIPHTHHTHTPHTLTVLSSYTSTSLDKMLEVLRSDFGGTNKDSAMCSFFLMVDDDSLTEDDGDIASLRLNGGRKNVAFWVIIVGIFALEGIGVLVGGRGGGIGICSGFGIGMGLSRVFRRFEANVDSGGERASGGGGGASFLIGSVLVDEVLVERSRTLDGGTPEVDGVGIVLVLSGVVGVVGVAPLLGGCLTAGNEK